MVSKHISTWLAGIAVMALAFGSGGVDAMTCRTALTYLLPCQPYLVENGQLTDSCCRGAHDLGRDVSMWFKRHLCVCIKQAARSARVEPPKGERLSRYCNIHLPLYININVDDCNKLPISDNLKPSEPPNSQL